MEKDLELHPVHYSHTVHAVTFPDGDYKGYICYSIRPANETFYTLPDGPKRVPGQFCKAAGKLAEAMMVSGFTPTSGYAIDIGAAPGGWTQQLARTMKAVLAIDPAQLHPDVACLSNVYHIKKMSQDAGDDITDILSKQEEHQNGSNGIEVDMVVCDANRHPLRLMEMLGPALKYLRPGGTAILTLKFRGKGLDKAEKIKELLGSVLGDEFDDIAAVFLLANTMSERTIFATKKKGLAGRPSPP